MTDLEIAAYVIDVFETKTFTDDPLDAGGPTKWGMTRAYIAAYLRMPEDEVATAIIRNLSREKALEIFIEMEFTRVPLFALIDWRPKLAVVDFGYNAGRDDSIPALQRAVGTKADGIFGMKTFEATRAANPSEVAVRVTVERLRFHTERSTHGAICKTCKLPSQKKFLGGWVNRCAAILERVSSEAA